MVRYKSVVLSRIVGNIACLYRQYHHEGGSCGQEVNTSNSRPPDLEFAQALEPEALTPLIYAGPNTKVVFTGDHMQVLFFIFLILYSTTLLACAPCCCGAWNNRYHQKNRTSLKENESNRN